MMSLRSLTLGVALLGASACSAVLDHEKNQCDTNEDCLVLGGHPVCTDHVCIATALGPENCFSGTPTTPEQFANQCGTATCESFDNCARLGLCKPGDEVPPAVPPPTSLGLARDRSYASDLADVRSLAGASVGEGAPQAGPYPDCVNAAVRKTIVVGGSTAVQPLLAVVAPLVATSGYQIAYQPSGSCTGVDGLFSTDANKRLVKDITGKQALLFHTDGTSEPCSFGDGTTTQIYLDVAVSDVFASSCTATYATNATLAEYLGPIQPMTFVVPATSTEKAISAEMGHVVFGRGNTDNKSAPYSNPALYFVRNSGSGTQQMISRAIDVDAKKWWGMDQGSSGKVRDTLESVAPAQANNAIGILSTDFADPERARLRVLAFKGKDQICAYYPDSTLFTRDKLNVRDGHYPIWGPVHFYANVSGGVPSEAAAALVTRFTLPRLEQSLLDAIIRSGFVPTCAMEVQRTAEMGPMSTFSPEFHCGCYFESKVEGGTAPASCQTCAGPADCPTATPACNNGYCEAR